MSQHVYDILIIISADMTDPAKTTIRTNARQEALEELLTAWVQGRIGQGPDPDEKPPTERDVYTVKISYAARDASFGRASDTGNTSLDIGIIMHALALLGQGLKALPLEKKKGSRRR
jgi:hypothetical protein